MLEFILWWWMKCLPKDLKLIDKKIRLQMIVNDLE